MHLRFQIAEKDFLTFQLYTLSKSAHVQSRMKRGRFFATLLGLILTFNLFISSAPVAASVMVAVSVCIYLYYPNYHKWRMKRNFKKYIRHNYHDRFDQNEELTLHSKGALSKNSSGEGEIPKTDFTELVEIENLYLLRMKNGAALILPRDQLSEIDKFKTEIKKLGIPFRSELSWKY